MKFLSKWKRSRDLKRAQKLDAERQQAELKKEQERKRDIAQSLFTQVTNNVLEKMQATRQLSWEDLQQFLGIFREPMVGGLKAVVYFFPSRHVILCEFLSIMVAELARWLSLAPEAIQQLSNDQRDMISPTEIVEGLDFPLAMSLHCISVILREHKFRAGLDESATHQLTSSVAKITPNICGSLSRNTLVSVTSRRNTTLGSILASTRAPA